jgi:hypothetical protein
MKNNTINKSESIPNDYTGLKNYYKEQVKSLEDLFALYDSLINRHYLKKLGMYIEQYNDALNTFSTIYRNFHKIYVEETVPSQREEKKSFVEATQIVITRLQNQYNQLVYMQQRDIAYIAIGVTVVFSVVSIILSLVSLYKC